MTDLFRRFRTLTLLLIGAATLAACDNPVDGDGEHPAGLTITDPAGNVVATFRSLAATGRFELRVGAPVTYTVTVLDDEGRPLPVGGELGLATRVEGGAASAAIDAGTRLVVTPIRAGSGQLRIAVEHAGHEEFAASFALVVAP